MTTKAYRLLKKRNNRNRKQQRKMFRRLQQFWDRKSLIGAFNENRRMFDFYGDPSSVSIGTTDHFIVVYDPIGDE